MEKEMMEILQIIRNYVGNGLAVILYIVSVVYLFIKEKDETKRIVLLYSTIMIMFFFLLPPFAVIIFNTMGQEVYYRILWLLPMTIVIAYAFIKMLWSLPDFKWKMICCALGAVLIMLTGDYTYDNPYFSRAENRFHVPQTVTDVCDAIIIPGREVKAAVPSEMLPYVRQYTANVCMPYGRDVVVETWKENNPLHDAMETAPANCKLIAELAAEQGCHYIVLHEWREKDGSFDGSGYTYQKTVDGYEIYLKDDAGLF